MANTLRGLTPDESPYVHHTRGDAIILHLAPILGDHHRLYDLEAIAAESYMLDTSTGYYVLAVNLDTLTAIIDCHPLPPNEIDWT